MSIFLSYIFSSVKEWNGVRVDHHMVVPANESKLLETLVNGSVVGGILFSKDIVSLKVLNVRLICSNNLYFH